MPVRARPLFPLGDSEAKAKSEADKAMAWLTKAVAAGYKNHAHIEKDPDLNSLRNRDDYKKLIVDLKGMK